MDDQATNFLREVPLFRGMQKTELDQILRVSHQRSVSAGSFYFYQEDPAHTVYILSVGNVKITQVTPEGQEIILRIINPGTIFGGIAILEEQTYPASAQSLDESIAFAWQGKQLRRLSSEHPTLAFNAMQMMSGHLQEFQDRFREIATERVERRLARLVLRLASQAGQKIDTGVLINLSMTRQNLAEMCGTTLFTVSRTLSAWEKQGIVNLGRERIVIIQPHTLVRIAEDLVSD